MEGASIDMKGSQNDWRIFLTKEWTMPRIGRDLEMVGNEMCQGHFQYRDVVSCAVQPVPPDQYNHTLRFSEDKPIYEMRNDGSGLPYENILELRADKIRNFLSVRDFPHIADVVSTQYEQLMDEGTLHLLNRIQQMTGIEPQCKEFPPREQPEDRTVTPEFAKHVRLNLNWTVESMVGYEIEWNRENAWS